MLINVPWRQEYPGVFKFLFIYLFIYFYLSLLPLAYSLIITVASRFLHTYSANDKTSRLMVKRFSTVRDTQRGSQSYMEKRRGSRNIEVTRRRRGGLKREEGITAINQFLTSSAQSGTLREVHRVTWRREEGGRR